MLPFVEKAVLAHIDMQLKNFSGYAQIRRVALTLWTVDSGLLAPILKLAHAGSASQELT